MVLRREGDSVLAIGQASHAWMSGQLARAWEGVTPREEVCLAAEQHDIGMGEWDLQPTLNPDTGLPHSFMEMPLPLHLELWTRAPRRLISQSAYAALLVSMHGPALYERRDPDLPGVRAYLEGQRRLQEELIAATAADPEALRRNQRLVWMWDWLSLALLLDWAPASNDGLTLGDDRTLDPWPFDVDQLELRCDARRLDRTFTDEGEMRTALADAPVETLKFVLSTIRDG